MKYPLMVVFYAFVAVLFLLAVVKLRQGKRSLAASLAGMGIVIALLAFAVRYAVDTIRSRDQASRAAPAVKVGPRVSKRARIFPGTFP